MKEKSNLVIKYSVRFQKLRKLATQEIKISFRETLELFVENPQHPQLRNHALRGRYAGYRSIDITGDWRAVFQTRVTETQEIVTFQFLGTHEQLYGKN